MKDNDIDRYIADFETLLAMANRHRTDAGSVDLFKQGLRAGLQRACMARRPIPHTLDEWEATTQEEVEIKALLDASIGPGKPQNWISSRESRYRALHQQKGKPVKKRDPNAMEIDAARTEERSKEERAKLIKERKCFICEKPGHIAAKCYSRNKGKGKARATTSKVHAAKAKEEEEVKEDDKTEESPPDYDDNGLVAAVKRMSTDKREAFLECMALEGF